MNANCSAHQANYLTATTLSVSVHQDLHEAHQYLNCPPVISEAVYGLGSEDAAG